MSAKAISNSEQFIPRDKPRSWVIAVLAALSGLGAGLIAFAADALAIDFIKVVAITLFVVSLVTFAVSWLVLISGIISGRYATLEPKDWNDQLW